ncbi:MAG: hypothetical protein AAFU53_01375 [Cyanobacteria bacterium J06632_3]
MKKVHINPLKKKGLLLLTSLAFASSIALPSAIAQVTQRGLNLSDVVRYYNNQPHQDRAISLLQQQINSTHPELLEADSIAANVWRDSVTLAGHEDVLGNIPASDRTGTDPLQMAITASNLGIAQPVTIEALYGPSAESPNQAMITITQSGILDDSVGSIRYRFDISRQDDQWTITRAGRQFRCQQGRGHQDFSTELCL